MLAALLSDLGLVPFLEGLDESVESVLRLQGERGGGECWSGARAGRVTLRLGLTGSDSDGLHVGPGREAGGGRQWEDEGGAGGRLVTTLLYHCRLGQHAASLSVTLGLHLAGLALRLDFVSLLLPEDVGPPSLVPLTRPPLEGDRPPGWTRHRVLELRPAAESEPGAHPEEILF